MISLSKGEITTVTSSLDFSGTLTVGIEEKALIEKALKRKVKTPEDFLEGSCIVASKYQFAAVACWPFQLEWLRKYLRKEYPKKQMVVNFPYGTLTLPMALDQMKWGLDKGAEEIDSVVPPQYLQLEDYEFVRNYVSTLQKEARKYNVEVKSIIRVADLMKNSEETGSLSKVINAGKAVVDGGGAFIKTCTGWEDGKATIRIIRALKEAAKGSATKVKASGGITCIEDGLALMAAGADRVAGRWPVVAQLENLKF